MTFFVWVGKILGGRGWFEVFEGRGYLKDIDILDVLDNIDGIDIHVCQSIKQKKILSSA